MQKKVNEIIMIELKEIGESNRILNPMIIDNHLYILNSTVRDITGELTICYKYLNRIESTRLHYEILEALNSYIE